jgi:hypothetical protein
MDFPDPETFFKAFGLMFFGTVVVLGAFSWGILGFRKSFPNFKHWFKYSVMKKKYDEEDVAQLLQYRDAGKSKVEVQKLILLAGIHKKRADEFIYIYDQILRKGGKKDE